MPALGKDKPSRAYANTRFVLELDGAGPVGVLTSIDGGHFKSEPIGQQVGQEGLVTRYPGRQKWDEFTIQVGTSMAKPFWDWIQASIDLKPQRKNGAVVALDFDGYERGRRTFQNALISEIQFPALDAKAKAPAFISVKIAVEYMEYKYSSQGAKRSNPEATLAKQKQYVPANYQVNIDKVGPAISRHVVKVDPVTIKQNIILNPIGNEKWARIEAGRIDQPMLSLYVPETYGDPWMKWWKSFVGEVEHDSGNESSGSIVYLASDCSTHLLSMEFKGIGITSVTFDKHEAGSEAIRNLKVDLYTETMSFSPGA
jgi:phage tail-like protein